MLSSVSEFISRLTETVARYRGAIYLTLLCYLVAYGYLAFNSTLAGDEWPMYYGGDAPLDFPLKNGRWIHHVTLLLVRDFWPAFTVTLALLLAALLLSWLIMVNELRLRQPAAVGTFLVLAGTIPFWAEMMVFRNNHIAAGIGIITATLFGLFLWRGFAALKAGAPFLSRPVLQQLLLAALCFSLSASCYQAMLPVGIMFVALLVLQGVLTGQSLVERWRDILLLAASVLLVTAVGIVLYAVQVYISREVTGISASDNPDYQLAGSLVVSAAELRVTVLRAWNYIESFLTSGNHLFPFWTKLLFGLAATAILWLLGTATARSANRLPAVVTVLLALSVLLLAPWVLGLVRSPASYRYNALVSNGILYAGVFALGIEHVKSKVIQKSMVTAACLVGLAFIGKQNMAAQITEAINLRDRAHANRVLTRLEMDPLYRELSISRPVEIVVLGDAPLSKHKPFTDSPLGGPLSSSIIECNVTQCQITNMSWMLKGLQVSELDLRLRAFRWLPPEEIEELKPAFESMTNWPEQGSIRIHDADTVLLRYSEEQ